MKESLKRSWKLTACRVIATFLVALVSLTSMAGIWRSSAQSSTCNYTQIPSAEGVVNISPDISADGNRVAYLSFDFSNILLGWQVRLYDASTGTSQQISGSGLPGALYPAISADGNRIAYQGCCEGTAQTPIYLYDSSTQTTTQISGANSEGAYPVLNANGSRVVYVTSVGPAGPRVVLYDAVTNTRTVVTAVGDYHKALPSINADGTKIAVGTVNGSGQPAVLVHDTTTGATTNVTGFGPVGGMSGFVGPAPTISADGTRIAFSFRGNLTGQNADASEEIFIYDTGSESFLQVTSSTASASRYPHISADGTRVAFVSNANLLGGNPAGFSEVFILDIPTSTLVKAGGDIDVGFTAELEPSINADGSVTAWVSGRNLTGQNPDHDFDVFLASACFPPPSPTPTPTETPDPSPTPTESPTPGPTPNCPTSISGDLIIDDNLPPDLDLSCVTTIDGNLTAVDSDVTVISLTNLQSVGGSIDITGNEDVTIIELPNLEVIEGDLTIGNNGVVTTIDLNNLEVVQGDLNIGTNGTVTTIDLDGLGVVHGDLSIGNNSTVTTIDLGSLESVQGDLSIENNGDVTVIYLDDLDMVGGSIDITGNDDATIIDISTLQTVGGAIDITGNGEATIIDVSTLETVGSDVTIANNALCTSVLFGSLSLLPGNFTVESCGTGNYTIGTVVVGGEASVKTRNYTTVTGKTAVGSTVLGHVTDPASMSVVLPSGAFTTPVNFVLTHIDPATLEGEYGTGPTGAVFVDPVSAYSFTFEVPTLNQPASLTFDVYLNNLDPATRDAILAAFAVGNATLATKGDDPDSIYQTFAVCQAGQLPEPDGCVKVEALDADGQPTTGTPSILRFSNVVGHFSTWAVAIATPDADMDGVPDAVDNCPNTSNADQADADADGIGDVCDPDDDNDGVNDDVDLCPGTPAGTQVNANGCADADGDGVADTDDNCPLVPNPDQTDTDNDGIGDACDTTGGYSFTGFFHPVDNLPVVNIATAGSSIPLKFSLGGYHGLNIFAAGFPTSAQVTCNSSEPAGEVEETVNSGGSSLTYDAVTDRYTYVWKTNKVWKGTCRLLVVRFDDGSEQHAKFRFR